MQCLDVLNPDSCLQLVSAAMSRRQVVACPRVGLTLKRFDESKEQYWMADYRYLSYPNLTAKMKDFVILSMIRAGQSG